ncbi:Variant surface glycoprotein [Trypanosoma congolense IL3000]|uniref:Variant surface glycoprotein n=1 Tax=Trypanosoma congolense (strain IL3000) TaxID=1068625 RepID=F9W401_TRYCI|nr:Variant surface glycoprotein [Trypanosoma congolense IL3000]
MGLLCISSSSVFFKKKKKMIKSFKVILMVTVMAIGVQSNEEEVILNSSDFGLLCNVTKVVMGLWNVADAHDHLFDKISNLTRKMDEIYFGSKTGEVSGRFPILPADFDGQQPKRSEVCRSSSVPNGVPSASDSLASTIFCLCMGTTGDGGELCELTIDGSGVWPENEEETVVVDFHTVWDDSDKKGVIGKCDSSDLGDNLTKAKEDLAEKLGALQTALDKKIGSFNSNKPTCEKLSACAKVPTNPTWLKKLKEFKDLAESLELPLKTAQVAKAEVPEAVLANGDVITHESHTENAATSAQAASAAPFHTSSQNYAETSKQEPKKASEEKAVLEPENPEKASTRSAADPPSTTENETSGSIINIPKWTSLVTLLI